MTAEEEAITPMTRGMQVEHTQSRWVGTILQMQECPCCGTCVYVSNNLTGEMVWLPGSLLRVK